MFKGAENFRIGDLFLYHRVKSDETGDYKFRFLRWEQIWHNEAKFSAILDTIVQESLPYFENQGGPGTLAYFTIRRNVRGSWPKFDILQEAANEEHCAKCAVPLEWASLAMKCPKCWTVY